MNMQPSTQVTSITCSEQILVDVYVRADSINSQDR